MMKKGLILMLCLSFTVWCDAQDNPFKRAYEEFKQKSSENFSVTRQRQLREFAETLADNWVKFKTEPPKLAFDRPKPKQPVVLGEKPLIPLTPMPDRTIPVKNNPYPTVPETTSFDKTLMDFYGVCVAFDNTLRGKVTLDGNGERDISKALLTLCDKNSDALQADCKAIANQLKLNGWGYWKLTDRIAAALCSTRDEGVLLHFFLLAMADYDVRIAKSADGLLLLTETDCQIYGVSQVEINSKKYTLFKKHSSGNMSLFSYKGDYNSECVPLGMKLNGTMSVGRQLVKRKRTAQKYALTVEAMLDKNKIDFYKDYPQCDYYVYSRSAVDEDLSRSVLSTLAESVKGKGEREAADVLLNFVQTAFEYQTDDDQFGYEKPLFVEETFYYPYCDCEDRAVLYQYLVRNLLHLDVVLLHYPNHLATAVRFTMDADGDDVMVDNERYIVCDPTYIGACVGMVMPRFKNVKPEVSPS